MKWLTSRALETFLSALEPAKWAVVTSAPTELAKTRMEAAGIPQPSVLIAAEDVMTGKPSPDGFLLAASRLGVAAEDCLAVEDSEAGIAAAEAAGCTVLVISETHGEMPEVEHMTSSHVIVSNFLPIKPFVDDKNRVTITTQQPPMDR